MVCDTPRLIGYPVKYGRVMDGVNDKLERIATEGQAKNVVRSDERERSDDSAGISQDRLEADYASTGMYGNQGAALGIKTRGRMRVWPI